MNVENDPISSTNACINSFIKALNQLTPEDMSTLRQQARKLLPGTRYSDSSDLISEAIYRAMEESRRWRKGLHPAVFLYQSMRSIASIDRRTHPNITSYGRRHVPFEELSVNDQLAALGKSNLSPDAILLAREAIDDLERICDSASKQLSDDPDALAILKARIEDVPMRELKVDLGLDERTFKAADQRTRQALRRARLRFLSSKC